MSAQTPEIAVRTTSLTRVLIYAVLIVFAEIGRASCRERV